MSDGCSRFLAYFKDTWDEGKIFIKDVTIFQDFPDVFPKDFSGLPPKRQLKFRIDLVPGAAPIVKAPYRHTLHEKQELSIEIQ